MVNTATKLIWTSFREDATKFAGSMQIKAEDILSLPQFTFGMYSRKQGFLPVRGVANALGDFPERDDLGALKREMEARYGPTPVDEVDQPEPDDGVESVDAKPDAPGPDKPNHGGTAPSPPDVEII